MDARIWSYGVCDSPDYFYSYIDHLLHDLGAGPDTIGVDARGLLTALEAKGEGYAISTAEELDTVRAVAEATGTHHMMGLENLATAQWADGFCSAQV